MPPKKKAPPKKTTKGYKMPEPLPPGEVIQDVHKRQFVLGPSIGKGGFGEIYSAQESGGKKGSFPYVIKIEPHANGPLFVEMHFYSRNAKAADIEAFKASKKMKSLGMPAYIASGTHEHNGEKFRFIVMDKFDSDLRKRYEENGDKLPAVTVFRIGLQMIDVLEYIHSKGYVHADIKEANILLSKSNPNQAYLVDFGLTGRFSTETDFKPNPKKMHDGTIEFVSRDAHQGVLTRRGDLEILAYNLIHWLGCKLPWEKNLSNPKVVQESKEKFMADIPLFMKTCFGTEIPDSITKFLKFILNTKFNEEPDYEKARKILLEGVKSSAGSHTGPLIFKAINKRKSEAEAATPDKKLKTTKKASLKEAQKRVTKKKNSVEEVEINGNNGNISSEEDTPVITARKPAKRTRQVPTTSTVNDNEDIQTSAPKRKPNLNKSLDVINNSDFEEAEELPVTVSRRREKETLKEVQKRVTKKKNSAKEVETTNGTNGNTSSEEDNFEDNPVIIAKNPAKRTRRVLSASAINNDGVIQNSEMMRIQAMVAKKKDKPVPKRKPNTRLNKSLDAISDSSSEEELPVTVSRRRAPKL